MPTERQCLESKRRAAIAGIRRGLRSAALSAERANYIAFAAGLRHRASVAEVELGDPDERLERIVDDFCSCEEERKCIAHRILDRYQEGS